MPRTRNFNVRLSDDELARVRAAAARVHPELEPSAWARDVLMRATKPVPKCKRCGHPVDVHECGLDCRVPGCACRRMAMGVDRG